MQKLLLRFVLQEMKIKKIHILTACGTCQERLFYWGDKLEVAVPKSNDSTKWLAKSLKDIQPYHWYKIFNDKK